RRQRQMCIRDRFESKPSTRTRRLDGTVDVHPGDARKIKRLLAER
ncbi:MAG: 50S ribosomal protein L35, partial [Actinobacteria bacterium]|nr:50S ribosomal protein L35 [Actinomycetota bacterium]